MSNTKENFYITTAISYVNGSPHLGHAYEVIASDVMARFKRLDGHDVYFLTGTDEHGQKVEKSARDNGMEPQAFCDKTAAEFEQMAVDLNISNDDFIRTTEERHKEASRAIWKKMEEKGDIYLGGYSGWYSVRDEAFFGEDEIQKDDEGNRFAPSGAELIWVEEPSYFFKLSAYQDKLLELYESNPDFIQPASRRNEIVSFVKSGLTDLSISRTTFDWGVPVPGAEGHIMYVWVDALTNYITGLGYPDEDAELFKKFWPCDVHVIGKDITRFHAIYWPAFLMSANIELPKKVFGHGFLNIEGQKMSKSIGNVLSPKALIDTFGLDALRFFLMREVPFGNDGNFTSKLAIDRINADLANGLGNLAQRSLSMIAKNCEGKVPNHGEFTPEDKDLLTQAHTIMLETMRSHFNDMQFSKGLESVWRVVSAANAYIDVQAPWGLKKTDVARMETVLYVLAEVIRCLGIIIQPVMPESANKVLDQLAVAETERGFEHIAEDFMLKSGTELPKPEGVFPRLTEESEAA